MNSETVVTHVFTPGHPGYQTQHYEVRFGESEPRQSESWLFEHEASAIYHAELLAHQGYVNVSVFKVAPKGGM